MDAGAVGNIPIGNGRMENQLAAIPFHGQIMQAMNRQKNISGRLIKMINAVRNFQNGARKSLAGGECFAEGRGAATPCFRLCAKIRNADPLLCEGRQLNMDIGSKMFHTGILSGRASAAKLCAACPVFIYFCRSRYSLGVQPVTSLKTLLKYLGLS